ncbi:hypothetical protein ACXIVK_27620 [Paraburkholderia caledonica]
MSLTDSLPAPNSTDIMDNYMSNRNSTDSISTSSPGPRPSSNEQIESVITAFGVNAKTAEDLRCAWAELAAFLEQRGVFPERVEDIGKDLLAMYATQFRSSGPGDNRLAALSTLLKRAGHSTSTLAALVVNTRRVRLSNGPNRRYRFERQRVDDLPSSRSALKGDAPSLTAG